MKKAVFLFLTLLISMPFSAFSAETQTTYTGSGEVTSSDPLYSRVTIQHGAIKGFSGGPETEFFVASSELLKNINKRDLVDFTLVDEKGDAKITQIVKTGEAPIREDKLEVGKAVQGVLEATGEVAKTVTSPIAPAHEITKSAVGATTDTTGAVLNEADGPAVKTKF